MTDKEEILQAIGNLADRIGHLEERMGQVENQVNELRTEVKTEVKRWDDRFFQLTKDTLGFTRAVVTTAAVVAVLTPIVLKVVDSPLLARALEKILS